MGRGDRGAVLWCPSAERVESSRLTEFARFAFESGSLDSRDPSYADLHRWSVSDVEGFWSCLADFFDVRFEERSETVIESRGMPGARWFPGSRLSHPAHLLRDRPADETAILSCGEAVNQVRRVSWAELESMAASIAGAMKARGLRSGDSVAGYLPNVPEAVAAFLAAASIGAVWISCSPDFGAGAVVDRLAQAKPRMLFAVDGYRYRGRDHDRREVVARIVDGVDSLDEVVIVEHLNLGPAPSTATTWTQLLAEHPATRLECEPVAFEHPLWVLFSSGTTGLPKGLIHSHGGILLEHLKWLGLHVDAGPGDRVMWLTTTGWTMWNFLVGALLTGASVVLYEGDPAHPDLASMWRRIDELEVTAFGAGAAFLHACRDAGLSPGIENDLHALRSIGSTGSPLEPEAYDWVYSEVKQDVWLYSTSGGTDVCTAFVGGSPWLAVRRGELQAPALGVEVQAWDENGLPLAAEEVGELVVTQPMPSMPIGLLNDAGERYRSSYFDFYPGVWRHGDWIEMTASGGAVVHGRSDSTINRGGVRIGTAEIYRTVNRMEEVADCVVVETEPNARGLTEVLLFVATVDAELDGALEEGIKRRLREDCSPRHVPNRVIGAPGIPRTLTGKVVETPLRRLLSGAPVEESVSRDALANPAALDWFAEFARRWREQTTATREA